MDMHFEFDSNDEKKKKLTLKRNGNKVINSLSFDATDLDPIFYPNIHLKVTFHFKDGKKVAMPVVFAEAIKHGWVPNQGLLIMPQTVYHSNKFPLEDFLEVTIEVGGKGDYNFSADADVEFIELPKK